MLLAQRAERRIAHILHGSQQEREIAEVYGADTGHDRGRKSTGKPRLGWACYFRRPGEMAEWLKAHAWKVCLPERVTGVRIPLSPPRGRPPQGGFLVQTGADSPQSGVTKALAKASPSKPLPSRNITLELWISLKLLVIAASIVMSAAGTTPSSLNARLVT